LHESSNFHNFFELPKKKCIMTDLMWSEDMEIGVEAMDRDLQVSIEQLQALELTEDETEFTSLFIADA